MDRGEVCGGVPGSEEDDMREKDATAFFRTLNTVEGVFELKMCKADEKGRIPPLAFNRVAEHQREALLKCCNGEGFYHKISDSFVGDKSGERRFPSPKPFDSFFLRRVQGYIVPIFWIPRLCLEFFYIPIQDFLAEEQTSVRKSIPADRIVELAVYSVAQNGRHYLSGLELEPRKGKEEGRLF
jgi:hypothetical protein